MGAWFEDEAFWADMYSFMFTEEKFTEAEQQVGQVLELVGFAGESVLDLCCGPGRHSLALARRGLQVTGVDRTAFFLDKARDRARQEGVEVEWVREDMRTFRRQGAFDLALNMYTSFGYFDAEGEDVAVLENMCASLKPDGLCVIDVISKERLARIYRPANVQELDDGRLLVQRHAIYDEWCRMHQEWLIIEGEQVKKYVFHHAIYSGRELKDRMLQAGFGEVKLYGDLAGAEYGVEAQRLIAVGRKI